LRGLASSLGTGVKPAVEMVRGTDIKVNRGIVVDDHLRTNLDGIYAAGDVAEARDIVFGDVRLHALWPIAVEQGKIAGANMIGLNIPYKGSVSRNIATIFGKTLFTGGMSIEDKFDVIRKVSDGDYRKIVLRDGVLKGFIFIGEVKEPGAYLYAMENQLKVSHLLDKLLDGNLSLADFHKKVYIYFRFKV